MKKYIISLMLCVGFAAQAQTSTPPSKTFIDTAFGYFSSFNPTLSNTFIGDKLDIWAGTENLDNERMTANLGAAWNAIGKLSLEGNVRNATVAGTVITGQAGVGYSIVHIDTKLTVYLHGGYRFDTHEPYVAPGIRVMKALTDNTFAGVSLELDLKTKRLQDNLVPTLGLFAGFKL